MINREVPFGRSCFCSLLQRCCTQRDCATGEKSRYHAFANVNLIPMTEETVVPGQPVLILGQRSNNREMLAHTVPAGVPTPGEVYRRPVRVVAAKSASIEWAIEKPDEQIQSSCWKSN